MVAELDHYLRMIADLPTDALNWRLIPSVDDHAMNSLAALAAHIAGAEHFWIAEVVGGYPVGTASHRPAGSNDCLEVTPTFGNVFFDGPK